MGKIGSIKVEHFSGETKHNLQKPTNCDMTVLSMKFVFFDRIR